MSLGKEFHNLLELTKKKNYRKKQFWQKAELGI